MYEMAAMRLDSEYHPGGVFEKGIVEGSAKGWPSPLGKLVFCDRQFQGTGYR